MAHPSPHELEEIAKQHLSYEVDRLLVWSGLQLQPEDFVGPRNRNEQVAHLVAQTTLESALVHLRNVAKFLTMTRAKAHRHDVAAAHYFAPRVGWRPPLYVLGASQDEHDEAMDEIDKRLVHLTTRRVGIGDFQWDQVMERVPLVLAHFLRFAERHTLEYPERTSWHAPSVNQIRNHGDPRALAAAELLLGPRSQ